MNIKKSFFAVFAILISASLHSAEKEPIVKEDHEERMSQMKNEVSANLTRNLLPFWSTKMADYKNGGYFGHITADDQVLPKEDKGGILNARILWTYSSAYRIFKDTAYLHMATRSKDYIMAHFIDKKHGGVYRSVKATGEPSDTRKQIYTQSFFIYGLAEYYRATGDTEALAAAKDIFNMVEKYALDRQSDGYFEVYSRDWKRIPDKLIGESTIYDEKTMNTHLHLMEAYTNLYRVWPDNSVGVRLEALVEIFLDKIIDTKTSHLICFMDEDWKKNSAVDSYGHDIESSWLLTEAAGLLDDPRLLSRVKNVSIKIADAAAEGLNRDGSLNYEKNLSNGHVSTERSWWVQSECIVGYLNTYELTGNEKYLDNAINCWNYTKNHFVDKKNGGWFSSVSESGVAGGEKGGFWVCPYHNGRMCMEVVERVSGH
jgi:cellobiose epimerase